MNENLVLILIIIGIIAAIILYKYIKPYTLKYDTTLFLTGGLGSGKTLNAVKTSIILIRKLRLKIKIKNSFYKLFNFFIKNKNKHFNKKCNVLAKKDINKYKAYTKKHKLKELLNLKELPEIYSNIPIWYKADFFSKKRIYCKRIKPEHILLVEKLPEYSVILIDEMPQVISQYEWSLKQVQDNFTEFITFFRHYIGGYFICTAQSTSEIVAPLRRKANQATWFRNFKKHCFGLFYSVECCDIMLSDDVSSTSTMQIDDNTKKLWGLFPHKHTYETRCYRYRYDNIEREKDKAFIKGYTNKILRLKNYISPCDDETTKEERETLKKWINERENKR